MRESLGLLTLFVACLFLSHLEGADGKKSTVKKRRGLKDWSSVEWNKVLFSLDLPLCVFVVVVWW